MKWLVQWMSCAALVSTLVSVFSAASAASPQRGEQGSRARAWHGDIRHFHEYDFARWRRGYWTHGPHDGRDGWWWVVGPTWYWYPAPVYPYPNPYLPPPVVAIMPPSSNGSPSQPQHWYYCADPPGYYPYVPQCNVIWQMKPAISP